MTARLRPALILPTLLFVGTISGVIGLAAPMLVTALMTSRHLSVVQAGDVLSARLMASTLAGLAVIPVVLKVSWRTLIVLSLLCITAGSLLSAPPQLASALIAFQILIGVGEGAASVINVGIAELPKPHRSYAILLLAQLLTSTVMFRVLAPAVTHYGLAAFLAPFIVSAVLALALSLSLPVRTQANSGAASRLRLDARAILALSVIVAFYFGLATLWAFVGRIGEATGLSANATSELMSRSFLIFGLVGAAVPMLVGARISRWSALSVAFGCAAAGGILVMWPASALRFQLIVALTTLAWMAAFPFLMAELAEIDRGGRLSLIGFQLQALSFSIGPAVGGRLLQHGSAAVLGGFVTACYAAAWVLLSAESIKTKISRRPTSRIA